MGAAASHIDGTGSQLVKAAKTGDAEHVMVLISAKPELLHYATYRQMSPAHFAAREDHIEVLQQLFSKAEEVDHSMRLHQQQGRRHRPSHDLVHQLANTTTDRGVTPLMLAVDKGCLASVKLLLQKGADPWAVDKLGGRTALHYAARHTNVEVIQALLEAGGETPGPVRFPNRPNTRFIDVRTQTGFTALHFAVHARAQQALAVLLNNGANPLLSSLFDCLDCINCPRGSTPLHIAARTGNADAARQILKSYVEQWQHRQMPDPRLVMDGDDRLPCQLASRRQHESLSRMLLPTTPLASLFADGQRSLIGPGRLAAIAGAVLRSSMMQELRAIEGREQALQQQHAAAADADADAEGGLAAGVVGAEAGNVGAHEHEHEQRCCADREAASSHAGCHCCNSHQLGSSSSGGCRRQQQQEQQAGAGEALQQPQLAAKAPAAEGMAAELETLQEFSSGVSDCSAGSDELCGVCFDSQPGVTLAPCNHQLCVSCCRHLLALESRCVLVCPFCRAGVGHLTAAAVAAVEV